LFCPGRLARLALPTFLHKTQHLSSGRHTSEQLWLAHANRPVLQLDGRVHPQDNESRVENIVDAGDFGAAILGRIGQEVLKSGTAAAPSCFGR
jgi:hypothetical protein